MIDCKLCGEKIHAVRTHLRDHHKDWTVARYEEEFPDAELLSKEAQEAIEKAKREQASSQGKAEVKSTGTGGKVLKMAGATKHEEAASGMAEPVTTVRSTLVNFHEAFKLGASNKLAFSQATGKPIKLTALDRSSVGEEYLIPEFDEGYIPDIEILKSLLIALELNIPAYVYGYAGLGKSTLWELICAATNRPIYRVQHTINTEESHITGQMVVENDVDPVSGELRPKTKFQLGDLPIAMLTGGVFLADEYDRGHPSVLSVYQAVLEGKPLHIKDAPPEYRLIKPHPQFRFVATGNTNGAGDESGLHPSTMVQDAATFERFGVVERVSCLPPEQEVAMLSAKTGCTKKHATQVVRFANKIRENAFPSEVSLFIGPRVLINIVKIGMRRSSMLKGVELCYANRLPESERKAALDYAQREFKS